MTAMIAVGLILVILIQNPKTGTLDKTFNSHQMVNVSTSSKVTEQLTWGLVTIMLTLCLIVGIII